MCSDCFGASWLAVVMFQNECRGRELVSREKFSSLVLVEKGAQVLPVEQSSTTGVAGTSEAEEEEDEAPPRIRAVRSRLVEQDPIILKFPEDDQDDATYVHF
ncbi:BQ5605_C001g00498 [Microbotryum silenes-dioicae]|uniref:BQ5605_C001g00498 protein n=1 Tax=Microbotryum silenes-dioicae TaxID=796604 RepID=A0A2X0M7I9_9BASI|nr:BQ5605_C001g00498 [Microbotryum silenes-dioicae]